MWINNWKIPAYLRPVIKELVVKAKQPFASQTSHNIPQCSSSCGCSGHGFFPNLPKLCHRGDYVLDKKTGKQTITSSCTKRTSSHSSLIPGIFTLSCVHGICYGFEVMEDVESPNIPFTILRTRFHTAPKLIIYDNACNLHNYCLNRDPVFFRDSWFVVDRFHWYNHTGCHEGYNLSRYMQHNAVNTQVAEQRNATFKRLKSMLSYMSLENFNNHLKLFIWFRSLISLSVLDPDLPLNDMILFKCLAPIYT